MTPTDAPGGSIPTWREAARTSTYAAQQLARLEALATRAALYAHEMDFTFLYDARRKLFSIGYQVATSSLDVSYYDLLASEARLASFIAIAKDEVPVEHWFRLGRSLTTAAGDTDADIVEREHVRVPDAGARHAVVPLHPAGPDVRGRRRRADRLRA